MSADWAMVIITAVYVIATIFICWANIKSAKASQAQLQEMQRQYAEENRPIIEVEFHHIKRTWYVVRFVNHGNKTAHHVKIHLEQDFIDSLPEEFFREELERIKDKECIIGVGQYYDLFIGSNELWSNSDSKPLFGNIEYESLGNIYKSDIFVDLEHYITFFSYNTEEKDLLKSINKINKELNGIKKSLNVRNNIEKSDIKEDI